jgi:hypothetical protein
VRVVLKVSSGSPHWNGDCDYAIVDLVPEVAALALRRIGAPREQQAADPQLNESYFWDSHAAYFSPWLGAESAPDSGDEPGETLEMLQVDAREVVEAPEDFEVAESQFARVDCEQMIVRKGGIAFAAIPKHGDFHVSTAEIPMEWLESAAHPTSRGSEPVPVILAFLSFHIFYQHVGLELRGQRRGCADPSGHE